MGMHVVRGTTWIKHMPILKIQEFCEELAQLADVLIRDVDDPLTLQVMDVYIFLSTNVCQFGSYKL